MEPYIYLLVNAIAAFGLHQSGCNFRGSSNTIKATLAIASGIGFLNLLVFTIYAMFKTVWWQPIVGLLAVSIIAPFAEMILKLLPQFIVDVLMIIALLVCLGFMYQTV